MSNSPSPRRSPSQAEFTDNLMKWIQPIAQSKGLTVRNFQSDWQNGMLFCAILHDYFPHLIDFNSLNPDNKEQNLQKAFSGFEKVGIQALLDAEDIAAYPDKLSILTYLGHLNGQLGGRKRTSGGSISISGIDELIAAGKPASKPTLAAPEPVRPALTPSLPEKPASTMDQSNEGDERAITTIETAPLQSLTSQRAMPPGRRQPTRMPSASVIAAPYVPAPLDFAHDGVEEANGAATNEDNEISGVGSAKTDIETENVEVKDTTARVRNMGGFSLFGNFDPSKPRVLRAPSHAVESASSAPVDDPTAIAAAEGSTPAAPNAIQNAVEKTKAELEAKHLEILRTLKIELAAAKREAEEARTALELEKENAKNLASTQLAASTSQHDLRLSEEREAHAQALSALQAEFNAYKTAREADLEKTRAEFESLRAQHTSLVSTHQQLQASAQDGQATAQASATARISDLESQVSSLQSELRTAREERESLEQAHSKASQEKHTSSSETISSLESTVSTLKAELHTAETERTSSREQVQTLSEKLTLLLSEIESEREKNSVLTVSLQQAESNASLGVSASHAEVNQLKEALERQAKNFEIQLGEEKTKFETLENSFAEAGQAQAASMEAERAQLKRQLEALENEKAELQQIHQATLQERQKAEIALERIQTERSLLEAQREALAANPSSGQQASTQALVESIAVTREELVALQKLVETNAATIALHNDSVSSKLSTLEQDLHSNKESLSKASQLANEMIVIRTKLREIDATASKTKSASESNIESLITTISGIRSEISLINERIGEKALEPTVAAIVTSKLVSFTPSGTAKLESTIESLTTRLTELESENRSLKSDLLKVSNAASQPRDVLSSETIKSLIQAEVAQAVQEALKAKSAISGRSLPPTPAAAPSNTEKQLQDAQRRESEERARLEAARKQQAEAQEREELARTQLLQARAQAIEAERNALLEAQQRAQQEANRLIEAKREDERRLEEMLLQQRIAEQERRAAEADRLAELEKTRLAEEAERALLAKLEKERAAAAEEAERAAAAERERVAQLERERAEAAATAAKQAEETARLQKLEEEAAHARRLAEEKAQAEEQARAAEKARAEAQARKEAEEAHQQKLREAEAQRLATAKREAELQREAEEKRRAEEAELARQAQAKKEAEEKERIEQEAKRLVSAAQPAQASPTAKKSLFDDVFDFTTPTKKTATPTKKVSLFDDDDDDAGIFSAKKTATTSTPGKKKSLFDDLDDEDAFGFKPKGEPKPPAPKSFFDRLTSAFN